MIITPHKYVTTLATGNRKGNCTSTIRWKYKFPTFVPSIWQYLTCTLYHGTGGTCTLYQVVPTDSTRSPIVPQVHCTIMVPGCTYWEYNSASSVPACLTDLKLTVLERLLLCWVVFRAMTPSPS